MNHQMTFVQHYGRPLADFFTLSRCIIAIIVFTSVVVISDSISYNWSIILGLLVIMWFTDALDGALGRRSISSQVSFLGRHEREIDLLYIMSIQIAVNSFYELIWIINFGLIVLALVALIQIITSEGNVIFMQMVYISIIYGLVLVRCIAEREIFLLVNATYVLITLFLSWDDFSKKVRHFISRGSRENFGS
ncbi:MAG: hypothetical protein ACXAB7_08465 [Candidatus Kariarchaeaceae archaeon]|jgi:hypothetical protein